MIKPSATYGNQYLGLTQEFAAQFKAMPPPSVQDKEAIAAPATPLPAGDAAGLHPPGDQGSVTYALADPI